MMVLKMMLGVNRELWGVLRQNQLPTEFYFEDIRGSVEQFLDAENAEERTEYALSISKQALTRHKKGGRLNPFVSRMVDIERGVQYFSQFIRDHINHSVYVYLLGLTFIEKLEPFREIDPLSWKIAALLHDIGYPPEWFSHSTNEYMKQISEASNTDFEIKYSVKIKGIEHLEFSKINSFRVII